MKQLFSSCFIYLICLSFLTQFTQSLVAQADDRETKRDTPEEGELRDQRMEITIRNSPYTRNDSTEDRYILKFFLSSNSYIPTKVHSDIRNLLLQ